MSVDEDGPPFTGSSPPEEEDVAPEKPDLMRAIERAAEKASRAGYGGRRLSLSIEVEPEQHNQWVGVFHATLST
jgi:hypothetical protein